MCYQEKGIGGKNIEECHRTEYDPVDMEESGNMFRWEGS